MDADVSICKWKDGPESFSIYQIANPAKHATDAKES